MTTLGTASLSFVFRAPLFDNYKMVDTLGKEAVDKIVARLLTPAGLLKRFSPMCSNDASDVLDAVLAGQRVFSVRSDLRRRPLREV